MNRITRLIILLLGVWLAFDLVAHLAADVFWFQEVGYLKSFLLRVRTQLVLWAIALSVSGAFLLLNLTLAERLKYSQESSPISPEFGVRSPESLFTPQHSVLSPKSSLLNLRSLLPIVVGLSLLIGLMLLHYGQIAATYWHPNLSFEISPPLPARFKLDLIWPLGKQVLSQVGPLGFVLAAAVLVLIYPQFVLRAIALAISLVFGLVLSANWARMLQYFQPTTFKSVDPLFEKDISFYVFKLPAWELLEFWLFGLFLFCIVAVTLLYLLSGDSLSQGRFPGFSRPQLRHLYGLGSLLMLALALRYWLKRYELLYSPIGAIYGSGYTESNLLLPIHTILSIFSLVSAAFLLWRMLFWFRSKGRVQRWPLLALGVYVVVGALAGGALPAVVQRLIVQPNELLRERPYLERSIALTRAAFDLQNIEVKIFDPQGELSAADLKKNDKTIRNIRLWDTNPLLKTNQQLQQIRLYYKFLDADIDRYTLKINDVDTDKQQVIIAARELDYNAVPEEAKTWVNKHLIYTHGYGFTLSPVNKVAPGGLPDYYVKDIATNANPTTALGTSNDRIRASIPIGIPRIYYGELTNTYVMTPTRAAELDYPSGNENVYNTYDGSGGVAIGALWQRLLFAEYLKDWQMLFTRNFTPQTKLLFRRNIRDRVRAIAPFLRFDKNPYLIVADADKEREKTDSQQNNLYWIIDAYTTSDRYPYSDPGKNEFNYIRNSVKVVINAYNGDVNFYAADPQDPIIKTWSAIFPDLLKPLDTMPATLRSHLRYPVDFFNIQSERLLAYHMTDPQVFYNREDLWQVPTEIYGSEPRPVQPYYLIMKLPTEYEEEFILLLPFTPTQRTNLIAWLAARSDGSEYGKLLLYQFPKQQLVYGTEQIEALINQDPEISQQISLWNRQGSRAIQGNLLVIPIEKSLLYVEPLYLEAEQNSLPTLVRVIVVYENRIVMAETLERALQAIFQPAKPSAPAIIRPVPKDSAA
ncbi:UPF0182 family protein [Microcoleus sp. FACHB-831]|uniref:UPF0182 family protein n=1 Tax=Microcoleus sp. FACHB-831 TaxID=2692827 RepID=UPI0016862303|nr:UPF0182 family protein [Microcoleus sp. FACHB-831]MBD1922128.1 UPF0182 family protein [Microcoleus sp. FACHB-831]